MTYLAASSQLTTCECPSCGGVHAVSTPYYDTRVEQGGFWHCPYCRKSLGFEESENERLEKKIKRIENWRQQELAEHDQTRAELRETESRRRAEKGAKTKLKKRIANGVCPCCTRTFQNLGRHMKNQHPEYTESKS